MTQTDHLAKAKEYIAIAESGDAKIEAYKRAAVEIRESGATQQKVASTLGRNQSWVQRLLAWDRDYADADNPPRPFGGAAENEARYQRTDRRKVEDAIKERPKAVAEAIAKAPAEVQRKIADELVKQPTEASLRAAASPQQRKPREPKAAEQKLSEAVFAAWEVGEMLLDAVPSGEARVRMTALAEKGERLHAGILHLLGTGELEAEFADLVRQVGAES